ncbi:MAG: F0F1 ATP synthase subunit A [Clostridia bacterium]|nr:F0F1 ATP synthase subunit A [Clostridia bacterium]
MKAKKILVRLIILLSVLLIVGALCLLVMTVGGGVTPPEESGGDEALISVEGARVILGIPALQKISEKIPLLELGNVLTTTAISLFTVSLILIILAALISRKIEKRPGKVQVVVEKLVTMLHNLVRDTMGEHNLKFMPYIGTLFLSSILGTLIGMTQIFPSATKDLSVTLAWALVTTGMVWYNNIKNFGFGQWLKGFTEPIVVMTPMNIVSEIAQPISLAFRHFGNVAGGGVLTALIYAALAGLNQFIFGWLPDTLLSVLPTVFQIGIPAVLSIYFDLFSGFVQALVFSLLTMVYVGGACPPPEELPKKKAKKTEG